MPPRLAGQGGWGFSWRLGGGWGRGPGEAVFRAASAAGNGLVAVTAHTAAWQAPELDLGLADVLDQAPGSGLQVAGQEWRVLRFNGVTRQSVAKVTAVIRGPGEVALRQQPNCLAFEYPKSMVAAGLTAASLGGLRLAPPLLGGTPVRILCIGLGGGSLPLFLADMLPAALVDIVEIDPAVADAAVVGMGFPGKSIRSLVARTTNPAGHMSACKRSSVTVADAAEQADMDEGGMRAPATALADWLPGPIRAAGNKEAQLDDLIWGSLSDRLAVFIGDGGAFVRWRLAEHRHWRQTLWANNSNVKHAAAADPSTALVDETRGTTVGYDMVFVDAYDGDDQVPRHLWEPGGEFLAGIASLLHPDHGTVVVNLHGDAPSPSIIERLSGKHGPGFVPTQPQGRIVADTCLAYWDAITPGHPNGMAFTVATLWQRNVCLVVSRARSNANDRASKYSQTPHKADSDAAKKNVLGALRQEARRLQEGLGLPFDAIERVSRGFQLVAELAR
eukprot:SM000372S13686  [mRNA]  locus=s372:50671:53613:+ [translate_table: standard]